MKYLTFIVLTIFFYSCNSENNKKEQAKSAKLITTICYLAVSNQDTVTLQLTDSNSVITGILNYQPYEKDSRTGKLYDIKLSGDTLYGMYQSTQEGQETFCEIAMLKKNNSYTLTNDIWSGSNYTFDSSYTHGKFIDKSRIIFNGEILATANFK